MASPHQWIFYDSLSKTQSNPIGTEDAQMAIFKMKPKEWSRFFIWTQGWTNWQSLDLFLKSDQKNFITHFAQAQVNPADQETVRQSRDPNNLEMKTVSEKTHQEITKSYSAVMINDEESNVKPIFGKSSFDVDELSWSNTEKPAIDFKKLADKMSFNRRAARHEIKIEILLISPKGKIFRSNSSNISLTGSLLEDNIPFDYYGIQFEVVIVNRSAQTAVNSRVTLKANTVGEGLTQRLGFVNVSAQQKKSLQGLLQDYLDQQPKIKKTS